MVPGPSYGTVAQSRVVAHVQITCVILENVKRRRLLYLKSKVVGALETFLITLICMCSYSPPQRRGCMRNTRSSALSWTEMGWHWALYWKEHWSLISLGSSLCIQTCGGGTIHYFSPLIKMLKLVELMQDSLNDCVMEAVLMMPPELPVGSTHRFRCSIRISGGLSRQVKTVVSLLSPHTEHSICSPPVRIVCSKNSDRQSCAAEGRGGKDVIWNNICVLLDHTWERRVCSSKTLPQWCI